ncbi:PTPA-CTERM sorting domain-containing protein [Nodosilinea sp. AN01ver1]|uniref:PTPA-CTERM sorting domain-containing protein n=1 Tax=Nodosilinea sp. AN01ver1 TaxID=3423362 RepID=UPI003D31D111
MVSAPAYALTVADIAEQTLSFTGFAQFNSATGALTFTNPGTIPAGADGVFGPANTQITVGNLNLTSTGVNTWNLANPVDNWLTGLEDGLTFSLTSFDLTRVMLGGPLPPGSPSSFFVAGIQGVFQPLGLDGSGSFSAQGSLRIDGSSYSADITAAPIPTPALLPGLLGLGVAALRKRNGEEDAEQA